VGRSVPSHLHRAKIPCTHGNVTHGDFRGVSGTVRTQPTVLNVLRVPRWGRVARQFLDEIFSLIQRNSHDEVLGFFSIKNLVINDLKRVCLSIMEWFVVREVITHALLSRALRSFGFSAALEHPRTRASFFRDHIPIVYHSGI
jgi:hypothetical protein